MKTIRAQSVFGGGSITVFDSLMTLIALAKTKIKLKIFVKHIDSTPKAFGMKISAEQTKIKASSNT